MNRTMWSLVALAAAAVVLALPARADLRSFAPANVSVGTSSQVVLAADNTMKVLMLTNTGAYPVWLCHAGQTAVALKGFYLPAGGSITFSGVDVPQQGLNGIAVGGASVVAIGKG